MSQRRAFDEVTVKIWTEKIFAGTPAAACPLVKEQLQLPITAGGYSAGGIMHTAPAAFMCGTLAALDSIHRAAKTTSVAGLRSAHPHLLNQLDQATKEVKDGTGYRSVEG